MYEQGYISSQIEIG